MARGAVCTTTPWIAAVRATATSDRRARDDEKLRDTSGRPSGDKSGREFLHMVGSARRIPPMTHEHARKFVP
jgi:hypothetical protein